MRPHVILFRKDLGSEEELRAAQKYIMTVEHRTEVPQDFVVIGRYSVLPFYEELEFDLGSKQSELINSYFQHKWIADFNWYQDLKEYTPRTWKENEFHLCDYSGPFVVKGATNSRKFEWDRLMFAKNKAAAGNIAAELSTDGLIGSQEIIYREYIPLKTIETGINGLPFTVEYRFFYIKDKYIDSGYYWSIAERADEFKSTPKEAREKADEIAKIVSKHCNFYVLDMALTENGEWILVEINDGQMSGLSTISPHNFYYNLSHKLPPWVV